MDFALLLLLSFILYIRPMELFPQLAILPFYAIVIIPCIFVSIGPLMGQLLGGAIRDRPITACSLTLLPAIVLADCANFQFESAVSFGFEFAKVLTYYLLVVGVIRTTSRLKGLLVCIVTADAIATVLAILHYWGIVQIPSLESITEGLGEIDDATGEAVFLRRLCGPGLFHDPNDMSINLAVGMMLSLYFLSGRGKVVLRLPWLAPLLAFGYALTLTHSRGGFLAFLAGLAVLFVARFGATKAIVLGAVALPGILAVFGGRQTDLSTSGGTSQDRIQIWMEGFNLMMGSPIFGIGTDQYVQFVGHVAHNSFVHAFVELGLVGGTLFVGAFYYVFWYLNQIGKPAISIRDPELRRLRPFLLAATTSYAVGMLSTTQTYGVPTFAMLAITTAYIEISAPEPLPAGSRLDGRLAGRLAFVGLGTLVVTYAFARYQVRWG